MNGFSQETQFHLLKNRLPEAAVMAKVWGANVPTVEEELSFVLADSDIRQFQVSGAEPSTGM